MNIVTTPITRKFMDEDGILHITILEGAEFTMASLIEDNKVNEMLGAGKKVLALVDARANFTTSKEAADYLRSDVLNKARIATAVVSGNLASRLLVNFFLNLKASESPTKLFKNEEEAKKWLLKQQQ